MKKEHKYTLGKVDYNGSGRKNCEAVITWSLTGGKFSMCAEIWNPRKTDIYCGGQCVDTVAAYFPHNKKVKRMVEIWKAYHLNDMNAASPAQQEWLDANGAKFEAAKKRHNKKQEALQYSWQRKSLDHYTWASNALKRVGLNPDKSYLHDGKPYKYGSAWLKRDIPQDIINEIDDWRTFRVKGEETDTFTTWLESKFDCRCEYVEFDGKHADLYRATLTNKETKERASFEYSQGVGHRKNMLGKQYSEREANSGGWRSQREAFSPKKSAPTIKAVIDAVRGDAQACTDEGDFLDFAETFGYEDTREARRVWQACETNRNKLRVVSGQLFGLLMNEEFNGETATA